MSVAVNYDSLQQLEMSAISENHPVDELLEKLDILKKINVHYE